jgi:protein TonB
LAYATLSRSSGNAALDQAALAAVRRAAPFGAPPSGTSSAQLRFSIPFYFR